MFASCYTFQDSSVYAPKMNSDRLIYVDDTLLSRSKGENAQQQQPLSTATLASSIKPPFRHASSNCRAAAAGYRSAGEGEAAFSALFIGCTRSAIARCCRRESMKIEASAAIELLLLLVAHWTGNKVRRESIGKERVRAGGQKGFHIYTYWGQCW